MSTLHVDSIIKYFGNKNVLNDVFLECKTGEIVGIFGRNGIGKTTLLKIIFGSLLADNKFIKVDNKILRNLSDSFRLIKFLPQHSFLPFEIKVSKAIDLFCKKNKISEIENHNLIKPILGKKIKDLSSGEIRIAEVIIMIYSDASFVLLDEPFSKLSPIVRNELSEIIISQKSEKGFIITDHFYEDTFNTSDRFFMIDNGSTYELKSYSDFRKFEYFPENFLNELR